MYSKAKDVGLSNSEYKKICYDLYTDGKITSESSTYWTDTDIEIIEASLIRNENINDLENVTN